MSPQDSSLPKSFFPDSAIHNRVLPTVGFCVYGRNRYAYLRSATRNLEVLDFSPELKRDAALVIREMVDSEMDRAHTLADRADRIERAINASGLQPGFGIFHYVGNRSARVRTPEIDASVADDKPALNRDARTILEGEVVRLRMKATLLLGRSRQVLAELSFATA